MPGDLEVLLEGIPHLQDLPKESRVQLARGLTRCEAVAGEYLFHQGKGPPPHVYYLISATAEIRVGPPDDERVVSLSRPGEMVGWLTVFTHEPFPASARVVEPGEILRIDAIRLRSLLGRHPAIGAVLATTMARRLEDLFEQIHVQAAREPMLGLGETFAFRKRVSEVMTSPVHTLPSDTTTRSAAVSMGEAGVSSMVVTDAGAPLGIVTEKDLVQKVLAAGENADRTPLARVMGTPLISLEPDAFLYKALGVMRRHRIRHLPVTDGGRLVGMISMRALMALGTSGTLELVESIQGAQTHEVLTAVGDKVRSVCLNLLGEGVPAEEVSHILSHLNRDVHRRVLEIAVEQLTTEGRGRPPVPFCFIVMGSHGRGENHFCTDQDHGMILADHPVEDRNRVEAYFIPLAERITGGLEQAGFPRCPGQVMSTNPVWRKPLSEWKAQVDGWFADPGSSAVRYTTLFYDFVPVWGDTSLADRIRGYLTVGIRRNHQLLRSLFEEAGHHKVPLTLFKNFITERSGPHKGQLDLKRSGLLFTVECSRILALKHGVVEISTLGRLAKLEEMKVLPRAEAEFIRTSYKTLFHFLLQAQASKLRAGKPVDHYVSPQDLPIQEQYLLRHALEATGRLQGVVHASFGDIFF